MTVDPYICPLDPETNITLKLYLYTNVKNVEEIRNNVIKGIWNCAVIKPNLILDPFQVIVAANKAVLSQRSGAMVTRTLYAEVLYNLSLTKNITQSLSKFGIESGKDLLVCFLTTPDNDKTDDILSQINGEMCPMSDLRKYTDVDEVKNVYKLNKIIFKSDYDLLDHIVSRIVTKNFISF